MNHLQNGRHTYNTAMVSKTLILNLSWEFYKLDDNNY